MSRKYIQHLRSNTVETIQQYGLDKDIPKVPETDNLKDGEIALNYAKDQEVISIKNDNNEIVKFLNEKVIYENEEITAEAIAQVQNKVNELSDNLTTKVIEGIVLHNLPDIASSDELINSSDTETGWEIIVPERITYNLISGWITEKKDVVLKTTWGGSADLTPSNNVIFFRVGKREENYLTSGKTISFFGEYNSYINTETPIVNYYIISVDVDNEWRIEKATSFELYNYYTKSEIDEMLGQEGGVQSDWAETNETSPAYIQNKPTNLSDFNNDLDNVLVVSLSSIDNTLIANKTITDIREAIGHGIGVILQDVYYRTAIVTEFSGTTIKFRTCIVDNAGWIYEYTLTRGEDRDVWTSRGIDFNTLLVQSDWNESNVNLPSFIKNKPTNLSDFNNDSDFITLSDVPQSDWDENDETSLAYIQNKPTNLSDFNNDSGLITLSDVPQSDWDESNVNSPSFIKNNPIFIVHLDIEPTDDNKQISIRESYVEALEAVKAGKILLLKGVTLQANFVYVRDITNNTIVPPSQIDVRSGQYAIYFERNLTDGSVSIMSFKKGVGTSFAYHDGYNVCDVYCATITANPIIGTDMYTYGCTVSCRYIYDLYDKGTNVIAKVLKLGLAEDSYDGRVYNLIKATPPIYQDDLLVSEGTLQFVSYEISDSFITVHTYNASFRYMADNDVWTYSTKNIYYNSGNEITGGAVVEGVTGSGQYDSIQLLDANGNNVGQPINCSQFLSSGLLKSILIQEYASNNVHTAISVNEYENLSSDQQALYAPFKYHGRNGDITWQEFINLTQTEQADYTVTSYNEKVKYMVIEYEDDSHNVQKTMIPLSDIFNSSNYYSKFEVDNKIQNIEDNFDGYKVVECSPIAITFTDDFLSRCFYDYGNETILPQEISSTYDVLVSVTKEDTNV